MSEVSEARRRYWMEDAIASTRIEGHVPSPEFLADVERLMSGEMTREEARAASLKRALAMDAAATEAAEKARVAA